MSITTALTTDEALDTVHELIERVAEFVGQDHATGHAVEPIEHRHVSGFIPFTDGGWDGVVTFPFLCNEMSSVVKIIAPFEESDYQDMVSTFRTEKGLAEGAEESEHPDWESFRDDWEQADSSCWFAKARAILYRPDNSRNVSGEDEFLFCFGINDDFDYGRDSIGWLPNVGTTWLWEENVKVSDLTTEKLAEIEANLRKAWVDA